MKKRRRFSVDEKISIVFKGLNKECYVSSICKKEGIAYSQFYNWKKLVLEGARIRLSKGTFKMGHPALASLTNKVVEQQKKIIEELLETTKLLKRHIKINGLEKRYSRYTFMEKKKIIESIEKSPLSQIEALRYLKITKSSFYEWKKLVAANPEGIEPTDKRKLKFELPVYKEAVFSILHSPPKNHGFNRTTWRLEDLKKVMHSKGLGIGRNYISKIIKSEGYRFLKARKVLTSTDPEYQEKLQKITEVLSKLKKNEKFFSIDEYGPFAVKIQGGRSLTPPGKYKTYPQFQKSKGCLILTGALELSTNQFTHFYSLKKNTEEMIKLLELLVTKYHSEKRIFLSWDAASWHMSKELYKKVDETNKSRNGPKVELMPLPACAQFLNVIESVFSGMARAIIHNSNYDSKEDCMMAIDRHFKERNEFYLKNPKRAGKKLWGKERVEPVFKESNNCKDPKYLHNF